MEYTTEDGVVLKEGDRAYNYYDMVPGKIGRHIAAFSDGDWFEFERDEGVGGGTDILNGQRICSEEYAWKRDFRNAVPPDHDPDAWHGGYGTPREG